MPGVETPSVSPAYPMITNNFRRAFRSFFRRRSSHTPIPCSSRETPGVFVASTSDDVDARTMFLAQHLTMLELDVRSFGARSRTRGDASGFGAATDACSCLLAQHLTVLCLLAQHLTMLELDVRSFGARSRTPGDASGFGAAVCVRRMRPRSRKARTTRRSLGVGGVVRTHNDNRTEPTRQPNHRGASDPTPSGRRSLGVGGTTEPSGMAPSTTTSPLNWACAWCVQHLFIFV